MKKQTREQHKKEVESARPAVQSLVEKHSLQIVKYIIDRLYAQQSIRNKLAKEKAKAAERIKELESKLAD